MGSEKVDVVIIFSKNCVVAYQWITYLTEILGKMFSSNDRSRARYVYIYSHFKSKFVLQLSN